MSFQTFVGNFALILFVLMVLTGAIWAWDLFVLLPRRRVQLKKALEELDKQVNVNENARPLLKEQILRQPTWVEYSGSFFPVIALVFILRSFLFEPFKIPSGSMLPTLYIGDLILVNKFTYGIRLPIIDTKIIEINQPQRGDVMVFKYPEDMSKNFIKRVVGIPGDEIRYADKKLTVNGLALNYQGMNPFLNSEGLNYYPQFEENLTGVRHRILNDDAKSASVERGSRPDFPYFKNCTYNLEGFVCKVPQGQYFMMGDNRDNSEDSRYWGFVPDANIVGKAFFIWMNFSEPKRIGGFK